MRSGSKTEVSCIVLVGFTIQELPPKIVTGGVRASNGFGKKANKLEHKLDEAKTLYTMIEPKRLWEFGTGESPKTINEI